MMTLATRSVILNVIADWIKGGQAMHCNYSLPWYHGSPLRLTYLRAGSTITQDKELARIFSHKPPLVVQTSTENVDGRFKHSGTTPGFLYQVAEEIGPEDVYPHPRTAMKPGQEWLTRRDLRLELIAKTRIRAAEILTEKEIEQLRRRIANKAE
jgi:hypothetical protein